MELLLYWFLAFYCKNVYMCVCVHICIHMHMYIHTYTSNIYIYIYMYIYMKSLKTTTKINNYLLLGGEDF